MIRNIVSSRRGLALVAALVMMSTAVLANPVGAGGGGGKPVPVRFATFNASLNRNFSGDLIRDLSVTTNGQARAVAEIIQLTRPDVLLVNEFDYDEDGEAAGLFQTNYLSLSQNGAAPIDYLHRFVAPSNTGIASGLDLDNNGIIDSTPDQEFPGFLNYGGDSFGFGAFPGQFGMVVYSMHPIDDAEIRTFQNFLWKDMPGALLPEAPPGTPWYSDEELDEFRLSSKSHWDLPIQIGNKTVHFLVSHPTPPVFDDPPNFPPGVDFNGRRNHDEIRFWADYVGPGAAAGSYIRDDNGSYGGLQPGSMFVIAGDQNSDPLDGDSIPGSAQLLIDHPRVNDKVTPSSPGGLQQSAMQGDVNAFHLTDPAFDTADFSDSFFPDTPPDFGGAPGNLRADYVLPSKNLRITDAGVFWPLAGDPRFSLVGSSDHRLVWVDVSHGGFK